MTLDEIDFKPSIEKCLNRVMREFAQNYYKEHGATIRTINFDWDFSLNSPKEWAIKNVSISYAPKND